MYKYEEMNLRELMSNDTLDPESAEVLYAMAQCYRLGKGTEVDMELYKKSLEGAVDAGSEVAKKELLSMENDLSDKKTEESAPEKEKNLKYLPIDELMDLAGTDDIKACCEVYRRYGIEESRYLIHAAELIDQGNHSLNKEECQKVLETLAEYYLNAEKDNKKAMEAYGKAAELGSAAACWKLEELCVDEQQKMFYAKKAADVGNDKDAYRYAEILREKGRRAESDACVAKLLRREELDERLKVQLKIQHHTNAEKEVVVQLAWKYADEKVCRDFLSEYYGPDYTRALKAGKFFTSDQAYQLAMWNRGDGWSKNPWYAWMECAAEKKYPEAMQEVKLEKECQEEEKKERQRKQQEEEQKRAERLRRVEEQKKEEERKQAEEHCKAEEYQRKCEKLRANVEQKKEVIDFGKGTLVIALLVSVLIVILLLTRKKDLLVDAVCGIAIVSGGLWSSFLCGFGENDGEIHTNKLKIGLIITAGLAGALLKCQDVNHGPDRMLYTAIGYIVAILIWVASATIEQILRIIKGKDREREKLLRKTIVKQSILTVVLMVVVSVVSWFLAYYIMWALIVALFLGMLGWGIYILVGGFLNL